MKKNMRLNRNGFTLVEVIVVSIIVAVLAAVAIPMYSGYIRSTKQAAVDQLAQTAAAAANNFYRKTGSDPSLADLNLFYDTAKFTVNVAPPNITVSSIPAEFTSPPAKYR